MGALVAANYLGQLSKIDIGQLAMTPAMQAALNALQKDLAHQLQQALASQLDAMNSSVAAAARNAAFDATMRRAAEQLVTSTAIREIAASWVGHAILAPDAAEQADVMCRMADRSAAQVFVK